MKRYISGILLALLIVCNVNLAQEKDIENNLVSDSINVEQSYKLRLNNANIEPILSLKMPLIFETYSDFYLVDFEDYSHAKLSVTLSNFILKNNINKSFQIYLKNQRKNDLGFVGEVLGYTNAAAALGLAAYNVYKYRDKYFRKK